MWDKFKNWHKKTWNEGNVGKGKIIGGWFIVLSILSSGNQNDNSSTKVASSSNKVTHSKKAAGISEIEKLKQECEGLATKYADSELMLKKYIGKFNKKLHGRKFEIVTKVQIYKVYQYNGSYYATIDFLKDIQTAKDNIPKYASEQGRKLIMRARKNSGGKSVKIPNEEAFIMNAERIAKTNKVVTVKLSGKAGLEICKSKDGKVFFDDFSLIKKEILRNGYIVDGYEPIKLLKIDE